jgi:hypothetical protein
MVGRDLVRVRAAVHDQPCHSGPEPAHRLVELARPSHGR